MSHITIHGLQRNLNNYYWFDDATIHIKQKDGKDVSLEIVGGNLVKETINWLDGKEDVKHRSVLVPGVGFKEWEKRKLITVEKYNPASIRTRMGVSRYQKVLFGVHVTHYQKRTSTGGFLWEEVYWPSGKLMYRYSRDQKSGNFFRPNGMVWGEFQGRLKYEYMASQCVLSSQLWGKGRLAALFKEGPSFSAGTNSFRWFDKSGRIRYQGQYQNRQKVGEWIENYKEFTYVRGVSVPRLLALAKPEDIDVFQVVQEKNAQLRAVLIEKIGINRIINELKGEIIDDDKVNDFSLIVIRIAQEQDEKYEGDRIITLLKVKCPSTEAYYTLRVPPGIKDVNTARQWTFGIDINSDFQLREEPLQFIKET